MKKQGLWARWAVGISCTLAGCGQELVLPSGADAGDEPKEGSTDGITGAAGAPDAAAPARLPVADGPSYTTFGGAGGDASGGAGGEAGPSHVMQQGEGGASGGDMANSGGAGAGHEAGSGGAPASDVPTGPRVLLFTEYLEGTGNLKALEIHSVGAASLEGCELLTFFNGKTAPARLALHGTLAAGGFQVLCSSGLAAVESERCDRSTNLTFNGDDALALVCDGKPLDVIGQIGMDPGEAWGQAATADHTLRRRCEVVTGRSDGSPPFNPESEWSVLGPDIFDDLGKHDCLAPRPEPNAGGAAP